jgi:hypothetical protein
MESEGEDSNTLNPLVYHLKPTIEELLDCKIYKLMINKSIYYVPLWQIENYFDIEGEETEIMVICEPIIDKNIRIDEENNLHIDIFITFDEIKNMINNATHNFLQYNIGSHYYHIYLCDLKFIKRQIVRLKMQGIPKPNIISNTNFNPLDFQKSDIIFYVNLYQ